METGEVVKWIEQRGFGFIRPDMGGVDLFAHISRVVGGDIREGDRVEFNTRPGAKGTEAVDVRTI